MSVFNSMGVAVACAAGFGIFSNLIVLIVRYATRRTSPTFQILLGTLAFNDLLLSILFAFVSPLVYREYEWIYPAFTCKLIFPFITTLTTVNVGTILFISYERYRAIMYPFRSKLSVSRTCLVLVAIWAIGLFFITPNIVTLEVRKHGGCEELWGSDIAPKIYSLILLVFIYIIPLITIATFHVIIIYKLKQTDNGRTKTNASQNASSVVLHLRRKRNMKIMRLLILISTSFAVCILPNKILHLIGDFAPEAFMKMYDSLHIYQAMFYFHVLMNPIFYSFMDKKFREDVRSVICCRITEISNYSFRFTT